MDAVQKANSGHPGMPMGMADAAVVLWTRFLKHNPADPAWPDRDRFVLSAGPRQHAALRAAPPDRLRPAARRAARPSGSGAAGHPGHPEHGLTPGVETTTGPLGQGIGNAVGMAIAERWLAARFNRPGSQIVDHYTYVIASDGDLMEGVSHEACALAGPPRPRQADRALRRQRHQHRRPDLAWPSAKTLCARFAALRLARPAVSMGTTRTPWRRRSAPPGPRPPGRRSSPARRTSATAARTGRTPPRPTASRSASMRCGSRRSALGWPPEASFHVPDEVRDLMRRSGAAGARRHGEWEALFARYGEGASRPGRGLRRSATAASCRRVGTGELPTLPGRQATGHPRGFGGRARRDCAHRIRDLIGGSADLTPSNNTLPKARDVAQPGRLLRPLHPLRRARARHGEPSSTASPCTAGSRPYGGTFLVFSDYMRPAIRLAALMELPVVYVFTHDSIGLGEDGPTHQPIEHLTALRAIPNLMVFRPADAAETVAAWRVALGRGDGPTALILTRQALPVLDRTRYAPAEGAMRGALRPRRGARPRAHSDRHGLRGADRPRGASAAECAWASAPESSPCRRWSCSTPSRPRTASRCFPGAARARGGGGRRHPRLGTLRGTGRRRRRPRSLRRFGTLSTGLSRAGVDRGGGGRGRAEGAA